MEYKRELYKIGNYKFFIWFHHAKCRKRTIAKALANLYRHYDKNKDDSSMNENGVIYEESSIDFN